MSETTLMIENIIKKYIGEELQRSALQSFLITELFDNRPDEEKANIELLHKSFVYGLQKENTSFSNYLGKVLKKNGDEYKDYIHYIYKFEKDGDKIKNITYTTVSPKGGTNSNVIYKLYIYPMIQFWLKYYFKGFLRKRFKTGSKPINQAVYDAIESTVNSIEKDVRYGRYLINPTNDILKKGTEEVMKRRKDISESIIYEETLGGGVKRRLVRIKNNFLNLFDNKNVGRIYFKIADRLGLDYAVIKLIADQSNKSGDDKIAGRLADPRGISLSIAKSLSQYLYTKTTNQKVLTKIYGDPSIAMGIEKIVKDFINDKKFILFIAKYIYPDVREVLQTLKKRK